MRHFLQLYQAAREVSRVAFEWRARDGPAVVDFLLREKILLRGGVGSLYPCGRKHMTGCFRQIIEAPGREPRAYAAYCPNGRCPEIALTLAEVEEFRISHTGFAGWLRSALGLGGELLLLDGKYPDTVQLGILEGGRPWDIFLSLGRDDRTLDILLAHRHNAERPSIVLAPAERTLPVGIRDGYPPGGHVVLSVLEDLVEFERGQLVVHHRFYDLTHRVGQSGPGIGTIYTEEGSRPLSAYEYPTWVRRAAEFDMFVDAIGLVRGHFAGRREKDGRFIEEELSLKEAQLLAELVRRNGAPVGGRDLDPDAFDAKSLATAMNRARGKADVRENRYQWRACRNVNDPDSDVLLYAFRPQGIRFAILVPLASGQKSDV